MNSIQRGSFLMSTKNTDALLGSKTSYHVHPEAKRYTLRDNGFIETKNGNFQYERTLAALVSDKTAPKLKITISKDISQLKLSSVSANGLKKVDLYKNDNQKEAREFADHILETLIQQGVLQKVG